MVNGLKQCLLFIFIIQLIFSCGQDNKKIITNTETTPVTTGQKNTYLSLNSTEHSLQISGKLHLTVLQKNNTNTLCRKITDSTITSYECFEKNKTGSGAQDTYNSLSAPYSITIEGLLGSYTYEAQSETILCQKITPNYPNGIPAYYCYLRHNM